MNNPPPEYPSKIHHCYFCRWSLLHAGSIVHLKPFTIYVLYCPSCRCLISFEIYFTRTPPTYTCSRKILCFRKIISNYAENIFMFTTAQSTPQRQLLVFACSCVQTTWLRDPWRYPLLPTAELPQVQLPSYSTTFQVKTTRCSQYLQF